MDTTKGNENMLCFLTSELESILEDIFLSGFHSTRKSTIEKLENLSTLSLSYGMKEGSLLMKELQNQLILEQESFHAEVANTMKAYSRMEFYLEHFKSKLVEA